MKSKKISIITPSLNRASLLDEAIRSVQAQNYDNYEHIIVDGGSTDTTEAIVKKYPKIKFISEPDQGMYDALNKGLDLATGEIIGFLNTDDIYGEKVFSQVNIQFEDKSLMAVGGKAIVVIQHPGAKKEIVDEYYPEEKYMLRKNLQEGPYFNAWFFHRKVFEQIGNFKKCYKIAGDRDFMLRFALNNFRLATIKNIVYIYRQHKDSLTFEETDQQRIASAKENLILTDSYLRNPDLPKQTKSLIINLHTRETAELALRSIWAINGTQLFSLTVEGIKYDIFWPFHFCMILVNIVPRFLLKKVRKFLRN